MTIDESTESPFDRARNVARFENEEFDLAVIGGGINGGAIARDAAMRGLKVALIERGDFASGTSSRSSKLIHGGFRYLPQGQLRLVYQALRERERLRHRTAPHLVHPIRFLLPVYAGKGFSRFTMSMGLWLYDLFARTSLKEWHENLNAERVRELEPALARSGLKGGALYYDGWGDDARITLENALDAGLHGAAVANYVAVEGLSRRDGRLAAASLRDLISGRELELRARVFANAAGPWVDKIRRMDDPGVAPCIRLTKGVHLVFRRTTLPVHDSLVLSDTDGRIVFVMPRDRYVLVGTTDTDYEGDPAEVKTDLADVSYLLSVLSASLPGIKLTAADVVSSFAGLRALVVEGEEAKAPSSVPREEVILRSSSGLLTVAGGKLTTHRQIAEKLVTRAMRKLRRWRGRIPTRKIPLPGARPFPSRSGADALSKIPQAAHEILNNRYGTRAALPASIAIADSELCRPLSPGCPVIGAEVLHSIRHEMVMTLADFMIRRTGLVWRFPQEARDAAPLAARLMARELGWDSVREQRELTVVFTDLERRTLRV